MWTSLGLTPGWAFPPTSTSEPVPEWSYPTPFARHFLLHISSLNHLSSASSWPLFSIASWLFSSLFPALPVLSVQSPWTLGEWWWMPVGPQLSLGLGFLTCGSWTNLSFCGPHHCPDHLQPPPPGPPTKPAGERMGEPGTASAFPASLVGLAATSTTRGLRVWKAGASRLLHQLQSWGTSCKMISAQPLTLDKPRGLTETGGLSTSSAAEQSRAGAPLCLDLFPSKWASPGFRAS